MAYSSVKALRASIRPRRTSGAKRSRKVPSAFCLVQAIYSLNGLPPPTPEELSGDPLDAQHTLLELIKGTGREHANGDARNEPL
jgi:hypothetical protein